MSALTASLIGWVAFSPVLAPVPPEPPPDPFAPAAMGIAADQNTLTITQVYENMPAGKAGLRTGDRLLRVGLLHPQDFGQVVSHVSAFRPGAVVEVEVDRGGQRKVFKMKLVPRPPEFGSPRYEQRIPFPNDP